MDFFADFYCRAAGFFRGFLSPGFVFSSFFVEKKYPEKSSFRVAGFVPLIFVGKSAQKNHPPGKSPARSSKIYTAKIPDTSLQRGRASKFRAGTQSSLNGDTFSIDQGKTKACCVWGVTCLSPLATMLSLCRRARVALLTCVIALHAVREREKN